MHFSHLNNGSGSKATKMAVVAGLHVLVATVFIHSVNTRQITMPKVPDDIIVMLTPVKPPPPPPPLEPPKQMVKPTMPEIVVPKVEVETPPPQEPPPVQATTQADPVPAPPVQAQAGDTPAQSSANNGAMRSAVLADANGCAKPAYPQSSLRNEETGTVTLALLVGADGKVTASRIQHSSGHRDLDKAAVNALSLCTFKPAMNNGVAEAGWAQLAYDWKID